MIKLRNMLESEFEIFTKLSKANYTRDKIKANGLTQEEAESVAEADFARILPDGFASKDNYLFMIVDKQEESVGHLWFVIRGAEDNRKAFLADIFLSEKARGKGYGRRAMICLEEEVQKLGLKHIGLHVFGFNERAIGLYLSLGYLTTDLVMEKTL
jgi:ribosomal protein S18 acetylase RimI-like enzyme